MTLAKQCNHESLQHIATANHDFFDVTDYLTNQCLNMFHLTTFF